MSIYSRVFGAMEGLKQGWETWGLGRRRMSAVRDCPVCLAEHDDEIHAATVSIREWFRGEVTKSLPAQGAFR